MRSLASGAEFRQGPQAGRQCLRICGAQFHWRGVASVLTAVGSTVVVENNLTLECTSLPPNVGAPACIICHTSSQGAGGLDLGFTSEMAYLALVNVASTSGNCGDSVYVVPGDLSACLLYDKLTNTPPACGAPMPLGGTFAGDTALIREWILASCVAPKPQWRPVTGPGRALLAQAPRLAHPERTS